jgi:hypothetical protein
MPAKAVFSESLIPRSAWSADGRIETSKKDNMVLKGITLDRLQDRATTCSHRLASAARSTPPGAMEGTRRFTQQAMGILTSSKLADAMDLSKEDPANVERYGKGDPKFRADGAPKMTENFSSPAAWSKPARGRVAQLQPLGLARQEFHACRQDMPLLDRAVSAWCRISRPRDG